MTNGGGTLNVNTAGGGNIELGVWDSTRNTFNQNSGALNVQNNASILFGVLGHNGQSTFNHNGGSVTFFSDGGTTPGGSGSLVIGSRGANGWEVSSGTYAYNLNGGTLTVPKIQKISTASATFNFNGGTLKPTAASTTFLQGLSAAYVQAGGAVVDTSGLDITIGQSLLADPVSTGGGLVKNGAGTLTLGGANSFTGTAIINQGTLQFSGQSSTVGNITAADSAKLAVRAIDAFTTVASCGTLTLGDTTGATLAFDFNSVNSSGSATALVVASDVTVNGALTTQYSNSVALTSGVVPLIQYTGTFTGTVPTGSITLGSRASGALSLDPDNKILNLVVSADSPKWTGLDSSEWTTGSTGSNQNWQLIAGGTTTSYLAGDTVLFDESAGSDHAAITITSADVSPGLTTFDHSAFDFTVTGGFGISGSGSLVKSGSGKLTLATPNSYSGSTSIQNGTLQLGDGSADGSLDGTSGVLDNGTLAYVLSGDQTAGYPITGFGKVTKSGSGTLTLGGTNTFSDGLDVSGGVVSVGSQANLGAVANIVTLDGGTLRTTQNAWWGDMTRTLRIGSGGGVLNIAGQATGGEGSRLVLWSGAPTGSLTGSGNLTVTGDGALDDFSGTGTLVIVGAYTGFTGNLILDQGGTVEFDNATPISATSTVILQDDSQVTVANGQNVANPITVSGTNSVIAFNNSPGTFSGAISLSNDVNIGLRNWWDFGIAQSGTLSGVISGSHGVLVNRGTSTGTPTFTLSGANTYTGNTTVAAGTTVQLAAAGGLQFVIGAAGDSNKITCSGAATLDGSFTFDLSGAATGTHSWTIVDTATKSFGPTFSVNGFTQASDIWKMTADGFTWSFSEASGVLSVAPAASGFDSWITGFGLTSQMEATDDPDGDGFNNLMEYALGGNPNSNSAAITPTGTKSGADFILTFSRSDASVSGGDLTLNLEYGDDLTGWTTVAVPAADNTVGGVSFDVTDGSPNDTVTATIPNAGGPTFFARIKAVK